VVILHATFGLLSWSADPTVLAGTAALAAAYVWLFRSRGSASQAWSPTARLYFAAGLLVLLLALESPIDVGGDRYLFSLHMLQHLLLSMVVPPLVLLGLPTPTLTLPQGGRGSRWLNRFRIHPVLASLIFNGVLVTWHLPFLYQATLTNEGIHVLEHLSFLATGILFWRPIIAPAEARHGLTPIGKLGYLGFAGIPPTILGIAFILSPSVLYPFYAAAPRVSGLGPLEDQQLAGLAMFGLGNLIYFGASAVLFFGLDRKEATAGDSTEEERRAPIAVGPEPGR
jgi:putative membrane protein